MTDANTPVSAEWLKDRLKRHFSELTRLALPAVMMRIGVMGLSMVDTALWATMRPNTLHG
ncbi:hypothetical protein [Kordiimonas gwangyangensis]|uniref:hypothetical protein n=1 Tax=Kordiimonas gwangyangensis TaxID=288022 RepID=UPI000470DB68|nr:hypothetical protein [Kordiimonas gwangyangensis]